MKISINENIFDSVIEIMKIIFLSAKLFCSRVYFQHKCFNYLIFLRIDHIYSFNMPPVISIYENLFADGVVE